MSKLWIVGMTMLCTGINLLVMDLVRTVTINPFHGTISCLLMSIGLVIVREKTK